MKRSFRFTPLAAACLVAANTASATSVTSCLDDGSPATLRSVITNAQPNDIIDLAPISNCIVHLNSAITIPLTATPLTIQGPATVSGSGLDRVFFQQPNTTLTISKVTVQDGHVSLSSLALGGCIESLGHLYLEDSVVKNCKVYATGTTNARGGGIYSKDLHVNRSTVSGNLAATTGTGASACGGGISTFGPLALQDSTVSNNTVSTSPKNSVAAGGGTCTYGGNFFASYSTLDGNTATAAQGTTRGGGAYAQLVSSVATVVASTISHNHANFAGGGLYFRNSTSLLISNSTISGNSATYEGGINVQGVGASHVYNSTIAFNTAGHYGGVCIGGGTAKFESTIAANNTTGGSTPSDLATKCSSIGLGVLSGSSNLIVSMDSAPPSLNFLASQNDPKLRPLQYNGGPTFTHMLSTGSPALGAGNNTFGSLSDQRGPPLYPRTTGPSKSVDIGAVQFDTVFADGYEGGP